MEYRRGRCSDKTLAEFIINITERSDTVRLSTKH
jgi:hypothetical protein